MKTILILGATSPIGAALSEQFSNGNRIVLSARNQARLSSVADRCVKAGAIAVRIAAADLTQTIQPIMEVNSEWLIDLIIDAASAASGASRVRDHDVAPNAMQGIIQADVLAHLDLYQQLAQLNGRHPDVVFISTVLAIVRTPGREIYSAAKRLIEIYLEKIATAKPDVRVFIFRIGKLIDSERDTLEAKVVADVVKHRLAAGDVVAIFGISGRILLLLNSFHPAVLNFAVKIHRIFMKINRTALVFVFAVEVLSYPPPAMAYIGPGLGSGALAAVLGAVLGMLMLVVGVVWYPIKRLIRRLRSKR